MPSRPITGSSRPRPHARVALALAIALLGSTVAPAATPVTLVVCAPGYPGSTAEAQAAMDAFAAAAVSAAGWKPGELAAVYFETERGGLDRLAAPDAALALVPLSFFLQHRGSLALEPRLQAVQQGGEAAEAWSLVAPTGTVKAPRDLAGWELASLAGWAPRFVRGPALGAWGDLPPTTRITFSPAVLSALRRAAAGEKVAVLLDRAQAAALPTLLFAARLEVVTRSAPLPVSVLAVRRGRLPAARLESLQKALLRLGGAPAGAEALAGVRLSSFVPADLEALTRAERAFDSVKE
jgi:hypothetical protein